MAMVSPCLFASGGGTHWVTCGTGDSGASPRLSLQSSHRERGRERPTGRLRGTRSYLVGCGPTPVARSGGTKNDEQMVLGAFEQPLEPARAAAGELRRQAGALGRGPRGLLGLAAASTAIALAVTEPPPWLDRNAYLVAISGAFFAGMAKVCGHVAGNGSKLVTIYVSLVVVAAGLTAVASLLL
ncbi:hypothetical protein HU200_055478 [Digitaria exilis]|uniref:Uncharacterized protein n=1 Tax=Digitaria exilis TaxID=1010633 RepID=A0A835E6C4_9POAL|nr:hypothetical protein HU200_055478 [Digitaria exilis]